MPFKLTMTLTKAPDKVFKQFVDPSLAEYIRQKFPDDNGQNSRKVIKATDTEWVGELIYQKEISYYTIMADARVSDAHTQWVNYNTTNGIVEKTVLVSM